MPFLRLQEMREMSNEKRIEKLTELQTELRKLTSMTKSGGSIDSPSRIKEIKKAIARLLTIQREKEIGGSIKE
ncbi:50S ribosomal protein L29 [Candidatus Bathyarchaeota archaeon]|nr:50S ribosomal protein L29 [Candidatus Bathyarchaeota archaeon]MCK5625564.1 50S ribosomal protein L29 [Candidatus Bathyarchaeota archaeon]